MTDEEIEKIKEHIEIHARKEPYAIKITEIMRRAVKQGFRIIHFLQLFQGILRVYRKAFAFQK